MNDRIVLRSIVALGVGLLFSAAAQAQSFRTYLSVNGTANLSCSLTAPCRLLPEALAAVADGGEVWMLDSANYNTGPVNVNKSVTILAVPGALGSVVAVGGVASPAAPGALGNVVAPTGNAINIATANVKVALRNLVIVPLVGNSGTIGINMTAGTSLTVDNCLIAGLSDKGIFVSASDASVLVTDTVLRGNWFGLYVGSGAHATVTRTTVSGGGYGVGAYSSLAATTTTLDMTDSTVDGSQYIGIRAISSHASGVVKASVRNSQVVRGGQNGISAESTAGGLATLSVSGNIISNNGSSGIIAWHSGAKVWASGNTVSDNGTGLTNSAALFETAGDNAVRNNGTPTSGAITFVAPM